MVLLLVMGMMGMMMMMMKMKMKMMMMMMMMAIGGGMIMSKISTKFTNSQLGLRERNMKLDVLPLSHVSHILLKVRHHHNPNHPKTSGSPVAGGGSVT